MQYKRFVNCTGYADVYLDRGQSVEPIRAERGPVVWPSQEGAAVTHGDGLTMTTGYEDFLAGLPAPEEGVAYLVDEQTQLVAGLLGRLDVWTWRYAGGHSGQLRVYGLIRRLGVGQEEAEAESKKAG